MSGLGKKDSDGIASIVELSDDECRVRVTFFCGREMSGEDLLYAMYQFMEEYKDTPQFIFSSDLRLDDERH
jgi:hypothetical protein